MMDLLESINQKLLSFNALLALMEILHKEFQALCESLEFSQQQVETLAAENVALRESIGSTAWEGSTQTQTDRRQVRTLQAERAGKELWPGAKRVQV